METIEEYNKRMREFYNIGNKGNGIECPKCGEEMYDSMPGMTLMSHPPQKNVACKCGYSTTVVC